MRAIPQDSDAALPRLGLVCITASNRVRYRTVTRKRLLQLSGSEQGRVLQQLYADNLERLNAALSFCEEEGIKLYRLTSGLFPFADEPVGTETLTKFTESLRKVGGRAAALGIRLVLHPDQFVVLSSDSPQVIGNSIKILRTHAWILDLLSLPRSAWTAMELHGGKGGRAERLVSVIGDLPDNVRLRLALENDEYAYGASDILGVCVKAGVPMVFDAHHHVIHENLTTYEDASIGEIVDAARTTWPVSEWQMAHISNGRESFDDPRHSDLITSMPTAYRKVPWIEVEAKLKEEAIEKLRTYMSTSWPFDETREAYFT
jgi:UV DNA damage endonuclease